MKSMPPQQLIEYFESMRNNPPSLDSILPTVRASGWTEQQITEAYNAVFYPSAQSTAPTPTSIDPQTNTSPQPQTSEHTQTTAPASNTDPGNDIDTSNVTAGGVSKRSMSYAVIGTIALIILILVAVGTFFISFNPTEDLPTPTPQPSNSVDTSSNDTTAEPQDGPTTITWNTPSIQEGMNDRLFWTFPVSITNNTENIVHIIAVSDGENSTSTKTLTLGASTTALSALDLPVQDQILISTPGYSGNTLESMEPQFGVYELRIEVYACNNLTEPDQELLCDPNKLASGGILPSRTISDRKRSDNPITPTYTAVKTYNVASLTDKPLELVE
jgi:hypothetical protein